MRKCAFLTTDYLEGFISDDELALDPFKELDWEVESISWRAPQVVWDDFDAVIIRTTWDYHKEPQAFLQVLEVIDNSKTELINPLDLVRWNVHKSYLRDLEARGASVVPTHWGTGLDRRTLMGLFDELTVNEIVIKPVIGASADDTFRITSDLTNETANEVETLFHDREYMAQPFVQSVVDEGEYSLFYFGGEHSHTILKTPKEDDFRVQEEHGGEIRAVDVDQILIAQGLEVVKLLDIEPLYARVDYVRTDRDNFALMELELIEPALYFRNAEQSAQRFAIAFDRWMKPA